mgnify:CR=1 FL=1
MIEVSWLTLKVIQYLSSCKNKDEAALWGNLSWSSFQTPQADVCIAQTASNAYATALNSLLAKAAPESQGVS